MRLVMSQIGKVTVYTDLSSSPHILNWIQSMPCISEVLVVVESMIQYFTITPGCPQLSALSEHRVKLAEQWVDREETKDTRPCDRRNLSVHRLSSTLKKMWGCEFPHNSKVGKGSSQPHKDTRSKKEPKPSPMMFSFYQEKKHQFD